MTEEPGPQGPDGPRGPDGVQVPYSPEFLEAMAEAYRQAGTPWHRFKPWWKIWRRA
jgi:hypothetical protein